MATLSFKHINKIYDNNVQAVFDFNLDIKDKEFIVFVGPSGCGKSTTLRMVAGLEDITSGELYIDGELVNHVIPKNRDIAMVFQSYALYPQMTVYENMEFALKVRKAKMPILVSDNYVKVKNEVELDELVLKLKEEGSAFKVKKIKEDDFRFIVKVEKKLDALKYCFKELKRVDKQFAKKQDDDLLLRNHIRIAKKLEQIYNEYNASLKPVYGIDEKTITANEKEIVKLKQEIVISENNLAKLAEKNEKGLLKANETTSYESIKDTIEAAIKQKTNHIEILEKRNEYLKNNEVQLFEERHLTNLEISVRINKTALPLDLSRYLFRKPKALSGGQRQRVALGRAIVRKPKVFLMDEPLSNLDAKLRAAMRSEISKIHENTGGTTIYVTHDQVEAMTMATRIVVMKDGWIQQIGSPDEVYADPANIFVAGFIGSPSMNFIDGVIKDNQLVISEEKKKFKIDLNKEQLKFLKDYEGKEVTIGIRPESIVLEGEVDPKETSEIIKKECYYAELLGSELLLHFEFFGTKIVSKTASSHKIKTHDIIKFCFVTNNIYFFDKETGKRIK